MPPLVIGRNPKPGSWLAQESRMHARRGAFCLKMTSTLKMAVPSIALPGQPLGPSSSYKSGAGTHIPPSHSSTSSSPSTIHASLLGPTITTPAPIGLPTLSIGRQDSTSRQNQVSLLPKEGSVILGRVTRINIREARVQILVIDDIPTMQEFAGVIRYAMAGGCRECGLIRLFRVHDVRATEKDRVKIYSSFRPGDIIRAEVVQSLLLGAVILTGRFPWETSSRIT